jgi:hypothetical protein
MNPKVSIADAGTHMVITGPDQESVRAALDELSGAGARVISEASPLGSRWVASCEKAVLQYDWEEPAAQPRSVLASLAIPASVKVSNAGGHLVLSSSDKSAMTAALDEIAKHGARVVSTLAPFGAGWIASCENPDIAPDECTVEEMGLHLLVRGPSQAAVEKRLATLHAKGAKLVSAPTEVNGVWVALCDTADTQGVMRFEE